MKKTYKSLVVGFIIGLLVAPPFNCFGAASGNYTDLLPIGAAGNTTVISNGSGWSLTTLAPSQTFGDALSRAPMTVYQSTSAVTVSSSVAESTMTAISGEGSVGSTTFPATWIATGRSIRVSFRGKYGTTGTPNWTWAIKLGTTTILTTGAKASPATQTDQTFSATGLITIAGTGASGTANANWDIYVSSAGQNTSVVTFSTTTASAVSVDLTTQLTVNPTFTWGTSSSANTLTVNNAIVEFLN